MTPPLDPHDIRLSRIRALRGPNTWHKAPVLTAEINVGEYERLSAAETKRFVASISPKLGIRIDTSVAREAIPRLLGLVALELQRGSGASVRFLDVRRTAEPEWQRVTIGYEDEEVAREALYHALDVIRAAASGTTLDPDSAQSELQRLAAHRAPGGGARALVAEARRRGIPVRQFEDEETIQLGLGKNRRRIDASLASADAAAFESLFPGDAPATIPIVAVTGTNGKTTTTRLIAHLLRESGRSVGYTTTDGTYIGNTLVDDGDNTGPFSANIVLSSPDIDVAVLEAARGGIIRAGLGFDAADVGVVINVTSDHLGIDDIESLEQLAQVKGVVAAIVKPEGFAVLNADDPLVSRMPTPGTVVYFTVGSPDAPALREHLTRGGLVTAILEERFVIRQGDQTIPLGGVPDVPLTVRGAARFQFENILAAAAAAFVLGVSPDVIRNGLMSFVPSDALMPGRLNMVTTAKGRILIDYAHNAAAIAGLMDFVKRLDARHRIGVIGAPGDRRDEDLRELGRLCGTLDYVIVKEVAKYRRGRHPGDTARVIAEGLASSGLPADQIEIVDDEPTAVAHAIARMEQRDLVIILADDHAKVRAQLETLNDLDRNRQS